jgi:peptidoglycan-N-acetylglucosamine deacetylase
MDRRDVLAGIAVAVATALSGCGGGTGTPGAERSRRAGSSASPSGATTGGSATATSGGAAPAGTAPGVRFGAPAGLVKAAVPRGTLSRLPGAGHLIALTIDDGTDSAVLGAYAELCRATGLRATFFCNGVNRGWTEHAPVFRPLLENDQVFIANHTWSHPDLRRLTSAEITDQVRRNETFLTNTYGVTGRPFLRPPFGYHDARLDAQLADLGYPAITMWLGTLGDATVETPEKIVSLAEQWFLPQHVVIGHANHPPVVRVMDHLIEIIHGRRLQPVHLGDVFTTPPAVPSGAAAASSSPSG